ncbi:MAG: hypothetical protein HYX69_07735 [Planctomycetia bacterium]|nr:hypothetical protein [Planctomycetia bacterium]
MAVVKRFVRSLPIAPGGVELEFNGAVLCRVTPPNQLARDEIDALLGGVKKQLNRSHERNRDVPARVIEREMRDAVKKVRGRRAP